MPDQKYRPASDAALALADGRVFRGFAFGATVSAAGEAVFTTTMTGYQEVCTDPSFCGQIVCMTYPLIGNYGVTGDDDQSRRPWIAGLVVRELAARPSNWKSIGNLSDYLRRHGVPGIQGVDTRALTRHIREIGDTRAVLIHDAAELADDDLVELARGAKLPGELEVVAGVSTEERECFGAGTGPHIVVLDCGVKRAIVRALLERGARVTVIPYGATYSELVALEPDGMIVSPGPGDPANLAEGLEVVRGIVAHGTPYFGICLGHQLLARAIGAKTTKLKFGHRGGNQPVRDTRTGQVTITSQNHGYCVESGAFPTETGWEIAIVNLNDGSVEGIAHRELPIISVQFHPEASPGPFDSVSLFDQFLALVAREKSATAHSS
ncbi:MAG: glutamine-hydrolyzing carbamoyl-phosphate synthase small subunit [Chloroflexia bacterium]|nr:glutamine-hydrolyzing carbamoyl-phosphate synthase small subunit [Chloroflexia bacterium]